MTWVLHTESECCSWRSRCLQTDYPYWRDNRNQRAHQHSPVTMTSFLPHSLSHPNTQIHQCLQTDYQ